MGVVCSIRRPMRGARLKQQGFRLPGTRSSQARARPRSGVVQVHSALAHRKLRKMAHFLTAPSSFETVVIFLVFFASIGLN